MVIHKRRTDASLITGHINYTKKTRCGEILEDKTSHTSWKKVTCEKCLSTRMVRKDINDKLKG